MALLGNVFKWRLISVYLEIVLTSTQDRCTVCAKYTIGLGISLDAADGPLCDVGEVEARFSPFQYSVNVDTR